MPLRRLPALAGVGFDAILSNKLVFVCVIGLDGLSPLRSSVSDCEGVKPVPEAQLCTISPLWSPRSLRREQLLNPGLFWQGPQPGIRMGKGTVSTLFFSSSRDYPTQTRHDEVLVSVRGRLLLLQPGHYVETGEGVREHSHWRGVGTLGPCFLNTVSTIQGVISKMSAGCLSGDVVYYFKCYSNIHFTLEKCYSSGIPH